MFANANVKAMDYQVAQITVEAVSEPATFGLAGVVLVVAMVAARMWRKRVRQLSLRGDFRHVEFKPLHK